MDSGRIKIPLFYKAQQPEDQQTHSPLPQNILLQKKFSFRKRISQISPTQSSPLFLGNRGPIESKYNEATEILMRNPHERGHEDVQKLANLTATMPFFQELNRKSINKSERVHERCCAVLRYEFFKKGDVVFNADEKPNKFYIIFSGSVNILIPKTETNFKKDLNKKNSIKITRNFVEKYTKQLRKAKMSDEELPSDEEEPPQENESFGLSPSKLRNEILKYYELLGGISLLDVNINNIEDLFVDGTLKFTYYSNLKEGVSFGELGLLRGKARSATVLCKEDCHLAAMLAEDYKSIVAVIERKKIYNKFEFFKKFLVKGIAYDNLAKLAYSFEKKKYGRNEYIFKEGDPGSEVFLIKKGEVQIHKTLVEQSQKNKKFFAHNTDFNGRKIPLLEVFNKKNQILITLLEGEFFGEDEIVNNNPNDIYGQRTYSTFVSSPKASVYVCPVQFFKKYIFERPNLLKKLREKYYIKKEIWEKQLSTCLTQRKDIYYRERNPTLHKDELQQISVFSEMLNEENKKAGDSSRLFLNPTEPLAIKKSVKDLKTKISEMSHKKVFKNEMQKLETNEKFINFNDNSFEKSNANGEKGENNTNSIILRPEFANTNEGNNNHKNKNKKISDSLMRTTFKKNYSLESQIKFINKKYDELIQSNKGHKHRVSEIFNFQPEKDNESHSRIKVYLKGKFKKYFNKSSNEQEIASYKISKSVKKFNESLEKSIKSIKEREKMDLKSLRISFFEDSQNYTGSNKMNAIKNNKHLTYISKIDLSNLNSMELAINNKKML